MPDLLPYQQRVVQEKQELDTSLSKLQLFVRTPQFEGLQVEDQELLILQEHYMLRYSVILGERIRRFRVQWPLPDLTQGVT